MERLVRKEGMRDWKGGRRGKGEWKKGYNRKPNRMKEREKGGWIKKICLKGEEKHGRSE